MKTKKRGRRGKQRGRRKKKEIKKDPVSVKATGYPPLLVPLFPPQAQPTNSKIPLRGRHYHEAKKKSNPKKSLNDQTKKP
jgi:hypothetical protein